MKKRCPQRPKKRRIEDLWNKKTRDIRKEQERLIIQHSFEENENLGGKDVVWGAI